MKKAINFTIQSIGYLTGGVFLIFGFLYFFSYNNFDVPKTAAYDSSLPGIELNDYRFHATESGDPESDKTLIILSGGPGGDFSYLTHLDKEFPGYRVVYFDYRGTGLSPRITKKKLSVQQQLTDIDAFVEHYRAKGDVSLIGHSWGGMLALEYENRFPGKVYKIIAAEPEYIYPGGGTISSATSEKGVKGVFKILRARFQANHIQEPDNFADGDFYFMKMSSTLNYPDYCNKTTLADIQAVRFSKAYNRIFSPQAGKLIRSINHSSLDENEQVLILRGKCPEPRKFSLKEGFNSVTIEGAGVFPLNDAPKRSAREIKKFLEEGI